MSKLWLAPAFVLVLAACGSRPEPAAPSPSDPAHAADPPMTSASAPPAVTAPPPDESGGEPRKGNHPRKPFTIHSSCAEVVTVAFGEDPKAATAGKRALASNGEIEGPRGPDGKQTVLLLDDKGEPIAKVHVTRGMKQVDIGRSCRTLDAR
jgi:hypothetical protein